MNKPVIRKVLIKVVRILLMSYVGMLAVAYFMQQKLVWPMSLETPVHRSAHPAARLVWMNQHEDKPELAVEGWFFPAPGASAEKPAPALIFFHGNNEVIDYCLEFVETYSRMGISVLLAEYRGYGRSGGTPGQMEIRSDMVGFYEWLIEQPDVDPEGIIYHGRSIGGGVASDLASVRKPAAMVLTSTFTSMDAMFSRFGVPASIVKDKYSPETVVAEADYPILVMHGNRDNVIPVSHGRLLGTLGKQTRYIEYNASHDLPMDWRQFESDVVQFLRDAQLVASPE